MQKIKCFLESENGKNILVVFIVILVGTSSFYLGRLSKEESKKDIIIENNNQQANVLNSYKVNTKNIENPSISEKTNNKEQGSYFASSRGHKYYPIGCSARKTIKQENRIYFSTSEEAEKAGFELSASC